MQNRLDRLFAQKTAGILNVYFTAGYPALADTVPVILALEEAGVDLIEVGIPYSDPLADGPTIQESGQQAIANGMTLDYLFQELAEARRHTDIPLVLMGYFNQIMQFGESRFVAQCAAVGIDGVILPDLPLAEYERDYKALFEAAGIHVSFLITPQTTPERIRQIDALSRSFIYMVSSAAITGASSGISPAQVAYFERIVAMGLRSPRLIGFGIYNHETFSTACRYAQGAIVGSAFIRALGASGGHVRRTTLDFVQGLRGAVAAP